VLDPFFSPKKMAEREPELRRQAGDLIDAIVAKGERHVVTDLATSFPSQVFLRGPNRCLGRHLAWLESRLTVEEWGARIREYSLANGTEPQVRWPTETMGQQSVPLNIKPA